MTSVQVNISDLFTLSWGQSQNKTNLSCQRLGEFLKTHGIMQDYNRRNFSWMMVVNTLHHGSFIHICKRQNYIHVEMHLTRALNSWIRYSRNERVENIKHQKHVDLCWGPFYRASKALPEFQKVSFHWSRRKHCPCQHFTTILPFSSSLS